MIQDTSNSELAHANAKSALSVIYSQKVLNRNRSTFSHVEEQKKSIEHSHVRKSTYSILDSQRQNVVELMSDYSLSSKERMPAVNKTDILKHHETIDAFVDQSMALP